MEGERVINFFFFLGCGGEFFYFIDEELGYRGF